MSTVYKSFYALGQLVVLRLANFIIILLLARYLGADAVGTFSLAIAYVLLLTSWWVGLDDLLIREIAGTNVKNRMVVNRIQGNMIYSYGLVRLGVSSLIFVGIIGFIRFADLYEDTTRQFLIILLSSSIPDGLSAAILAGLVGTDRFGIAFGLSTLQMFLRLILVIPGIFWKSHLLTVAWGWLSASLIGALAAIGGLYILFFTPVAPVEHPVKSTVFQWRTWLKEVWGFAVIGIVATTEYQLDVLLLSVYHTTQEVGYYSIATTLFAAAALPLQAFRTVIFPSMARMAKIASDLEGSAEKGRERLENLYHVSFRWLFWIVIPYSLLGSTIAPLFIKVLFNKEMEPAIVPTQIIMFALIFFALNIPQTRFLLAIGQQNRVAWFIAMSATVNLAVNIWAIPRYGAIGAAFVRCVSTAVYFGVTFFVCTRMQVHKGKVFGIFPVS